MSKTLSNILTVFKVARIVAKVIFILCIIGAAGCVLGVLCLPMAGEVLTDTGLLELENGLSLSSAYVACIVGLIACLGEIILAFLAERYFKNVLNAATPFTFDGAKECFRLGIASIIVSISVSLLAGLVASLSLLFTAPTGAESEINTSISVSTGLFFLFLSLIFKHGAELKKTVEEASQENSDAQ